MDDQNGGKNSKASPMTSNGFRLKPLLGTLIVGLVLWFAPSPQGVTQEAWHLLAIFTATIVGIVAKPLPMPAVALIGIAATVLTRTLEIEQALSGFSYPVIWLIVFAFLIARGFIATGLSRRIAYFFIALLGRRTLGLAYGLVATDLLIAPAIPSNTARSGGVIFPVFRALAKAYNSDPETNSSHKIGAFLAVSAFQGTLITSAMFMTAMAANPLLVELAAELGIEITWVGWMVAASVPGFVSLVLMPLLLYWIYPPEITKTPAAAQMAREVLHRMGPMKKNEWIMLGVFLLLLTLWIFGGLLEVHSTTTALVGLAILLLTRVLRWENILDEREAWNTLVWFAALVMMARFLNELGFIPWFSQSVRHQMAGLPWIVAYLSLSIVYFYSHYLFASNTAQVSSMYAPFLAATLAVGTPPLLAAVTLAIFSNVSACTTHYGTGAAPIFFGARFVDPVTWWRLGAVLSLFHLLIWLGLGIGWWKLIGLW
jgi:DASS family divalent anion:Na+ symporter